MKNILFISSTSCLFGSGNAENKCMSFGRANVLITVILPIGVKSRLIQDANNFLIDLILEL